MMKMRGERANRDQSTTLNQENKAQLLKNYDNINDALSTRKTIFNSDLEQLHERFADEMVRGATSK